jgi:hypothetical protein
MYITYRLHLQGGRTEEVSKVMCARETATHTTAKQRSRAGRARKSVRAMQKETLGHSARSISGAIAARTASPRGCSSHCLSQRPQLVARITAIPAGQPVDDVYGHVSFFFCENHTKHNTCVVWEKNVEFIDVTAGGTLKG